MGQSIVCQCGWQPGTCDLIPINRPAGRAKPRGLSRGAETRGENECKRREKAAHRTDRRPGLHTSCHTAFKGPSEIGVFMLKHQDRVESGTTEQSDGGQAGVFQGFVLVLQPGAPRPELSARTKRERNGADEIHTQQETKPTVVHPRESDAVSSYVHTPKPCPRIPTVTSARPSNPFPPFRRVGCGRWTGSLTDLRWERNRHGRTRSMGRVLRSALHRV